MGNLVVRHLDSDLRNRRHLSERVESVDRLDAAAGSPPRAGSPGGSNRLHKRSNRRWKFAAVGNLTQRGSDGVNVTQREDPLFVIESLSVRQASEEAE
jgi:hypothetical protein